MERFARRYPKPSSQFQYNLFQKNEIIPSRKTNVGKVCFPFSLLLFFTINFYWLSMFLSFFRVNLFSAVRTTLAY